MSAPIRLAAEDAWTLGLNVSHNGAACLLHGDRVAVAVQEERLTRRKYDRIAGASPSLAVAYCLDAAGITAADLTAVGVSVQGAASDEEHDVRLNPQLRRAWPRAELVVTGHHRAHAYSAFATSGFSEAAVLVVDGEGSPLADLRAEESALAGIVERGWETISGYVFRGGEIRCLFKEAVAGGAWMSAQRVGLPSFGSLGGMYAAVAQAIFGDPLDAGKVMGLAPYGMPTIPVDAFFTIRDERLVFESALSARFAQTLRWPHDRETAQDLAASVQRALEVALLELCRRLRRLSGSANLCFAGGVALNSVANERIVREGGFDAVHFMPAAEDSGVAIGAAYEARARLAGGCSSIRIASDAFGKRYAPAEVREAAARVGCTVDPESHDVFDAVAEELAAGRIAGWFFGGSEFGPRSLGQRSILCDARDPEAKAALNGRVKHREAFRPFAPAVLAEHATRWFDFGDTNPASSFMLRVLPVREEVRGLVPAIVHVDGTARVQTVGEERGELRRLLMKFFERTGVPLLLNTSFNVMGEPIVETPDDALNALLEVDIDLCVIEGLMCRRPAAIASVLDLHPRTTITGYDLHAELTLGEDRTRPLVRSVSYSVTTPFGAVERHGSYGIIPILTACDGRRSGHDVLEIINRTRTTPLEPDEFVRILAGLRREGALRYAPPA
ncbi:MAG TPA: carbamoyltransferase C-terminal domain-containing protein [Candidatus Elarobacter sp.]|nr:carbamoyltransferase C-terminal domain-containing protein [Candidatus Elarobacter sp.]